MKCAGNTTIRVSEQERLHERSGQRSVITVRLGGPRQSLQLQEDDDGARRKTTTAQKQAFGSRKSEK